MKNTAIKMRLTFASLILFSGAYAGPGQSKMNNEKKEFHTVSASLKLPNGNYLKGIVIKNHSMSDSQEAQAAAYGQVMPTPTYAVIVSGSDHSIHTQIPVSAQVVSIQETSKNTYAVQLKGGKKLILTITAQDEKEEDEKE